MSVSRPKWTAVQPKRDYAAPKLTVLGKIDPADPQLDLSPDVRRAMLELREELRGKPPVQ